MTSEYTPTEDEWREATTYSLCDWWRWFESEGERDLAWARFIARVKADALRTEADRIERAATNITHVAVTEHVMVSNGAPGLLRESADRIEKEGL